ncbi:unnamed protein product [Soboliphyme baturini]|uniref:Doublecortin domain-containing protein n=1 Tax=Soboliphyme baturini TaxID=241478 RepID=A0A183INU6_9BILA|nr:unnamed protein product [Soboliphyme baturini]
MAPRHRLPMYIYVVNESFVAQEMIIRVKAARAQKTFRLKKFPFGFTLTRYRLFGDGTIHPEKIIRSLDFDGTFKSAFRVPWPKQQAAQKLVRTLEEDEEISEHEEEVYEQRPEENREEDGQSEVEEAEEEAGEEEETKHSEDEYEDSECGSAEIVKVRLPVDSLPYLQSNVTR